MMAMLQELCLPVNFGALKRFAKKFVFVHRKLKEPTHLFEHSQKALETWVCFPGSHQRESIVQSRKDEKLVQICWCLSRVEYPVIVTSRNRSIVFVLSQQIATYISIFESNIAIREYFLSGHKNCMELDQLYQVETLFIFP